MMRSALIANLLLCASAVRVAVPALDFTAVEAQVAFSKPLRPWVGFGFNHVKTAQTRDCQKGPQE